MKSKLIMLLLLVACAKANGQLAYTFTKSIATFNYLPDSSRTVITSAWPDAFIYSISDLVDVDLFGDPCNHSSFSVNDRGDCMLTTEYDSHYYIASAMGKPTVGTAGFVGYVSYKDDTIGTERVLKVEYKDAGFADEWPAGMSHISFQIWLYSGSNIVEFHYGPSNLDTTGGVTGINAGIFEIENVDEITTLKSYELYGNPDAPTADTGVYILGPSLAGLPANGTVYRFTPVATAVANVSNENNPTTVFYQSGSKDIVINSSKNLSSYHVYDISGRCIYSGNNIHETHVSVNMNAYPSGIYMVKAVSNTTVTEHKVLVF